jgi:hypothetical protein
VVIKKVLFPSSSLCRFKLEEEKREKRENKRSKIPKP